MAITKAWLNSEVQEDDRSSNFRHRQMIRRFVFDKYQLFENSLNIKVLILKIYYTKRGVSVQFLMMTPTENIVRDTSFTDFKALCMVWPYATMKLRQNDSRWFKFLGYINI